MSAAVQLSLSLPEQARLVELEERIERGLETFLSVGQALAEIHDSNLYRGEASTWAEYVRTRWGMSRTRSYELMGAARALEDVRNSGHEILPVNEAQANPLTRLPVEERADAWRESIERADGQPTAAIVEEVVLERLRPVLSPEQAAYLRAAHDEDVAAELADQEDEPAPSRNQRVITASDSTEWFTPPAIVEAARRVMGGIDLDPASCAEANETVQATSYYTRDCSGLGREWAGRVFLNPPYGRNEQHRSNMAVWGQHLLAEVVAGRVTQAILLVGAYTDTELLQGLLRDRPVCLTGRLAFIAPGQGPQGANRFGSAIAYLGPANQRFANEFAAFGVVVRRF